MKVRVIVWLVCLAVYRSILRCCSTMVPVAKALHFECIHYKSFEVAICEYSTRKLCENQRQNKWRDRAVPQITLIELV